MTNFSKYDTLTFLF